MVSMHFPLMMGGGVIWNCSRFESDLFMCLDMQFAWPMPQCIYASNCWAISIRIESNAIFGQRIKRSTDRIGFKLNSHSIFSTNIIYIMVLYTFVFCFHVRISISRFLFLFCLFVWSIQRIRTILYIYMLLPWLKVVSDFRFTRIQVSSYVLDVCTRQVCGWETEREWEYEHALDLVICNRQNYESETVTVCVWEVCT